MTVVPTAIVPPRSTHMPIRRAALVALTERVAQSRMTVVSAPAGSGKTTAMLFWADELRAQGRPVLWLAARAGIESKRSFLQALKAAGIAAGMPWDALDSDASDESWLSALATMGSAKPVIIVDDAQFLAKPILEFLAQLSSSARDALTIIIAARGTVGLSLARMRALGFLVEVGVADLSFTLAEATELVTRSIGSPVDSRDLQAVSYTHLTLPTICSV